MDILDLLGIDPGANSVRLKLGEFEFNGTEVPESINFGGTQALAVHELVGGVRVIDAMGAQEVPPTWRGILYGPLAQSRAHKLDAMRRDGKPLPLTWSDHSYTVVISNFEADFEQFYRIPYRITCTVASNDAADKPAAAVSLLAMADLETLATYAVLIADANLISLIAAADLAMAAFAF